MLKGYSLKDAPMTFDFIKQSKGETHFHDDVELLYVFDGKMEIVVEKEKYQLDKNDFLIVNANKSHSFILSEDALIGSFLIPYTKLSELTKQTYIVFWCNSTIDKSSAYEDVRKIVFDLANEYIQNYGIGEIRLISKCYELLYQISKNFLITSQDTNNDDSIDEDKKRIEEITRYVAANYRNRISLNELAEILFLSDAYLSKYIKRHFGMNFLDYLNNVRLNHAVEELLYSDMPITRIALDNGFASVATFNKVFKQKYNITPSVYKADHHKHQEESEGVSDDDERIFEKAKEVLGVYESSRDQKRDAQTLVENIDAAVEKEYQRVWCKMINIGAAQDLLHSNMQEHIVALKKQLKFKYVRIWDLYSSEMYIDINAKNHFYNFDKLNRVLDFLVSNNLYPYIELNIKPKILIKNSRTLLISGEKRKIFRDLNAVECFFEALIVNLIDRYGAEEIENWYFEFWKEENLEQTEMNIAPNEEPEKYIKVFGIIWRLFKKYIPKSKIGGAGLSIRYGEKNLVDILRSWSKEEEKPDFLSFYCYPYIMGMVDGDQVNKTSTDRDFLKNYIKIAKELMSDAGFSAKEFHISEWNSTVSNRNFLNDSCYKAAYIIKNLIDSFDKVDLLGYWLASDVFADFYDSTEVLNGSSGLLTKDGIHKPAFYAFEFMNRLFNKVVKKGDRYVVTSNGNSKWGIACHNYKFLSYKYFMSSEDEIEIEQLLQYYEDTDAIEYEFVLDGLDPGSYQIKTYSINNEHGSVLNEWIKMSCPDTLDYQEIEYLKRICVPRLSIRNVTTEENVLRFKTTLSANEIQYINIEYKLKKQIKR
ncbi:MAG: helix-turn-helix domain-containing protein [Eubacteriales bacterium]